MIEVNKRGIKYVFPAYLHWIDKDGNRFLIDIWSKPWYLVFMNFRAYFPVNAILLDDNCYLEVKSVSTTKMRKSNIALRGLIGFSLTILFLWIFRGSLYIERELYICGWKIILIVLIIILYATMLTCKKRVFENNKLYEMQKVKIRIRTSIKSIVQSFSLLFVLSTLYQALFIIASDQKISIFIVFSSIILGILILVTFFLQWSILATSTIKIYK